MWILIRRFRQNAADLGLLRFQLIIKLGSAGQWLNDSIDYLPNKSYYVSYKTHSVKS